MPEYTKQIEILLLPEDELDIEREIRREFPTTKFLDNRAWESPDRPPSRSSILECSSTAAIWRPDLYPTLPTAQRRNGVIDGPQVGEVVQWLRSTLSEDENVLQSGRWAATLSGTDKAEMDAFVKKIWKILRRLTSNRLVSAGWLGEPPDNERPERLYHAGTAAMAAARAGHLTLAAGTLRLLPE